MKIGILGTGDVGRALGRGFVTLGYEVKLGGREATNERSAAWAKEVGPKGSTGTFADAAGFGEMLVMATEGVVNEAVIKAAGTERFDGKVVIDATNPLDFSKGRPPVLAVGHSDSGGEQLQRALRGAWVVKAFNIVGNQSMFRPSYPDGVPDMLIAGNDKPAKERVTALLHDFGWTNVTDLGPITSARYLESLCMTWVLYGVANGTWNHAFKVLRK